LLLALLMLMYYSLAETKHLTETEISCRLRRACIAAVT
jgi:hypothetical protein